VRLIHFSDLHLRDRTELPLFERQLARALEERPAHIVISGDLVDRWHAPLLLALRDLFAAHALLDPRHLTIIHGNHDLASSGGWPRNRADILRMVLRFWDPPPLLAWRRARFARYFEPAASRLPFERTLAPGVRLLAIDSTPLPWVPFLPRRGGLTLRTALGVLRNRDLRWLSQREPEPTVLIVHHWPLPTPALQWNGGHVSVPMHVVGVTDRFWTVLRRIGVRLVLCGHVHRTLVDAQDGMTVAAQGQSGADWAGRPFSVYEIAGDASLTSWVARAC
jgi:3',5'-cyclic AMP phosphodiesterase CpdA